MKPSTVAFCAFASAISALPACTKYSPVACAGAYLPVPQIVTLVYPADGSTAVPDSPGSIVFQKVKGGALSGVELTLTPPSGSPIVATPGPVPSPLPTPNTPPSPGAGLIAFTVPALAPATAYQASVAGSITVPGSICGQSSLAGAGSFTTR